MVQQSTLNKIAQLQKAGAPSDYIKTVTSILESKSSSPSSSSTPKSVVSSSKSNAPQNTTSNVVTSTTKPSFFSKEGQKQAFSRVAGVFAAPFTGDKVIFTPTGTDVSAVVKPLTVISAAGSLAYGGALIYGATGAATATGAAATTSSSLFGAKTALTAAGLGVVTGGLLFGGKTAQTAAPQTLTQTPNQITNPAQTTISTQTDNSTKVTNQNQYYVIKGSPNASIYGSQTAAQTGQTQTTTPTQTTTAGQDTSGGQSQQQSAGTDIFTLALIGVGAYLLLK